LAKTLFSSWALSTVMGNKKSKEIKIVPFINSVYKQIPAK